jgi:hypothetical protein
MHCTDCGKEFHCGMNDGEPCWCSTEFAPRLPVPEAGAKCYCPECLAAILRAQLASSAT